MTTINFPTIPQQAPATIALGEPVPHDTIDLTPDAIMAYCSSRLRMVDDQVQQKMADQQHMNDVSSAVGTLVQWYSSNPMARGGIQKGTDNSNGATQMWGITDQFNAAIKACGADTPEGTALAKLRDQIVARGDVSGSSAKDVLDGDMQAIKQVQTDVNNGAELNMIDLQSLMSQRQQAIQMSTNLVQALGDQLNKIADNVGH